MDQPVFARRDLHKGAKAHDAHHFAIEDIADLRVFDNGQDGLFGLFAIFAVGGGDAHRAVLFDVDLGVGVGGDLLDHRAALANDVADLLRVDGEADHLGRIGGELGTGLPDAGQHHFVQDLHAGGPGLFKRLLDDLQRQAVALDIHLDGGNALFGARHFEIHIAEEIFDALDIGKGDMAVAFHHQAAGNAGHRRFDGHAGIHQGQGGAAHAALAGGTVGRQHFRHQAEGIGELFRRGDHRLQRTLGQSAVPDLPAARGTGGLGFAHRITGEVILVHVALFRLFVNGVQLLGIPQGAQRAGGQHLGLAPGEQARTMDTGQQAHFRSQRPYVCQAAAVHTLLLIQQHAAHHVFLQLVHALAKQFFAVRVFFAKVLDHLVGQLVDGVVADSLVHGQHGLAHLGLGVFLHIVVHLFGHADVFKIELLFADLLFDAVDEGHQLFDLVVGDGNGPQHLVFGELVGAGLDHDHFFRCAGHRHVQLALFPLLAVGAHHIGAVYIPHVDTADGAAPGDIRNGQGHGSADHGGDLRQVVIVHGHHSAADDHIVAHVRGEQGTDGPVDQAGSQNGLFRRTAFPAHKAAGDAANGVQALFKIHREGEEIDAVTGLFGSGGVDQHTGIAPAHHAGAVGQPGQLAGLDHQLAAGQGGLITPLVGEFHFCNHSERFLLFYPRIPDAFST